MLLLDTAVLVWVLQGGGLIGPRARALIDAASAVHVSAASIIELTIKSMIGKVRAPADLSNRLAEFGLLELPISNAHADAMRHFPELVRHDPFDRLLVAQASCTGMELLTPDRALLKLERDFIVDVRI